MTLPLLISSCSAVSAALISVLSPSHDACQCPQLCVYLSIVDFLYEIQRETDLCNIPSSAPNGARLIDCPTQTGAQMGE